MIGAFLLSIWDFMKRVSFYIDGFNLYHSLREVEEKKSIKCKWLDLDSLCRMTLPTIEHALRKKVKFERACYFTTLATQRRGGAVPRHRKYLSALRATKVDVQLGRFKRKESNCHRCGKLIVRHEEKETDVAIACEILGDLFKDQTDVIVMVTGDTDLAAAVRKTQSLFPNKEMLFAFPHYRFNNELKTLLPNSFKLTADAYKSNQFPQVLTLEDGQEIEIPAEWK